MIHWGRVRKSPLALGFSSAWIWIWTGLAAIAGKLDVTASESALTGLSISDSAVTSLGVSDSAN